MNEKQASFFGWRDFDTEPYLNFLFCFLFSTGNIVLYQSKTVALRDDTSIAPWCSRPLPSFTPIVLLFNLFISCFFFPM